MKCTNIYYFEILIHGLLWLLVTHLGGKNDYYPIHFLSGYRSLNKFFLKGKPLHPESAEKNNRGKTKNKLYKPISLTNLLKSFILSFLLDICLSLVYFFFYQNLSFIFFF